MKEGRDFSLIYHINCHYFDLTEDIAHINSFEEFVDAKEIRRAILFDFLQIGELLRQLSKNFRNKFGCESVDKISSIRDRIVHGYSAIRDDIIYRSLKEQLPGFIDELNAFAKTHYDDTLRLLLGKKANIVVDRPFGTEYQGMILPINCGYLEALTTLDGRFQEAYVLDVREPKKYLAGTVVAVVHQEDGLSDRLVVSPTRKQTPPQEIEEKIGFLEGHSKHVLFVL